jgi:hypothetical protein
MILFVSVPGSVRSVYSKQEKFLSGVIIVFHSQIFYYRRETVDHVMILFVRVPGSVKSVYSRQEMFLSGVMIVFRTCILEKTTIR